MKCKSFFYSTAYLLLPSLSFQFHPSQSSAYCTHCAVLPSVHAKPYVGSSQLSPSHILNFSHLSLWSQSFFFRSLPWVGWSKWYLVIWRMEKGGGVRSRVFVGRYPSHFETLATRHLIRIHAAFTQVVQFSDVSLPSSWLLNFSERISIFLVMGHFFPKSHESNF